jgi:hypothetical protein
VHEQDRLRRQRVTSSLLASFIPLSSICKRSRARRIGLLVSFCVLVILSSLIIVLPLAHLRGQPALGWQDATVTPTSVGIPGIDASATAHLGGTIPGNPEIQFVKVADGFTTPTNIAFPPDGSGRIFVVELDGKVRIINPDGSVLPEPFLDLSLVVSGRPGQQGLLGLAFHPNFAENGKFYVDYNDIYDNGAITVSEFTVAAGNPNKADTRTERPLMVIEKRSPLHNGGTLRFGPDGYLFVSIGDGGWQGDVWDNAQNRFTLLGKILRIDVDRVGPGQPYGIPPRRTRGSAGASGQAVCRRSTGIASRRCARKSGHSDSGIHGNSRSIQQMAICTSPMLAPIPGKRSTTSQQTARPA